MKTKKRYFILAVATAILCVPVLAEIELPLPEDRRPILIGRPNPTLAGIEQLYVVIAIDKRYVGVTPDIDPNEDGLVWKELETKVINKLREAGMKVVGTIKTVITVGLNISELSELRVDTDMLKLKDSQQYVFRIQASVSREVRLARKSDFSFRADVWKTHPLMQMVSVKDMPATVTNAVLEHVEAFIHAYLAANPHGTRPSTLNDITVKPEKLTKPDVKPAVAEHKYIASKNSKVFHKPECSWAKRILPKNLVGYNNRGEAIQAGKRPCKMCKP